MYREEETIEVAKPEEATSPESESRHTYTDYVSMGGRLDEENYARVMKKAEEESGAGITSSYARAQVATIADISGISLEHIRDEVGLDPVVIYEILRNDKIPKEVANHHSQMIDQQLLVESLRMLGAQSATLAIIAKHPHITFN